MKTKYNSAFFASIGPSAARSAQETVPLVMDLVAPKSVVDLGCGTGDWLAAFRSVGKTRILGVDGGNVDADQLKIPRDCFVQHDLSKRYSSARRFDLAMSLEVAEHLDEHFAETFIESLISLAPAVLFSAAVPNQAGVHHVNCQWPAYWARIFDKFDYQHIDCLRLASWENANIAWWYRQNMLLYVNRPYLKGCGRLSDKIPAVGALPASLVHPEFLQNWIDWGFKLYEASQSG